MTTTTAPQLIEAELGHTEPLGSDTPLDPLAQALRQRGFRSVSIGLRTAQIDGMLYELCPVSHLFGRTLARAAGPRPRAGSAGPSTP